MFHGVPKSVVVASFLGLIPILIGLASTFNIGLNESLKEDFSNKHYKEATLTIKKDFGNYSLHTYFGTNFESEKMFTSLFYNF